MKRVKIEVTQEDIDMSLNSGWGRRKNILSTARCECPITIAARKIISGAHMGYTAIDVDGKNMIIGCPEEAVNFVMYFDRWSLTENGEQPQPFSFEIEVPDELVVGV